MLPRQLGIAFGHLDIRVAEDFRELVEIAEETMRRARNDAEILFTQVGGKKVPVC